jgi:hypothetical protein
VTVSPSEVPAAARAFLSGAIDYAGLFPPAELAMPSATANYLAYRSGPDAWALGRFVVPAARLGELTECLTAPGPVRGNPLPVSALVGAGPLAAAAAIETFNEQEAVHGARVEVVEAKAESVGAVQESLAAFPARVVRYVEIPIAEGNGPLLDAVQAEAGFAKLRTGGVTADGFPAPESLLLTLRGLAQRKLPFKATAGLHHPLRGLFPLTYAPDAPAAMMYGYLNILLAATILWTRGGSDQAQEALLEESPASLCFEDDALVWRDLRFDAITLEAVRADFFHGFGSCSFREPFDLLPLAGVR